MRVAITGSNGFIGSNLSTHLVFKGHEVVRLVRPNLDNLTQLATRLKGTDTLVHCAWSGHPRNEVESQRNIYTSMTVAKAAGLAGVGHMVFISSGGGTKGATAYAKSKLEIESLLSKEFGFFPFDLTVLRPSAVYGKGQDPSKGLGAVTTFLDSVMKDQPIHILGSPYSGRDFLHVDDLTECICEIIEQRVFGSFEVGGPEVVQLNNLIRIIERALGKTATVQIENPTGVDPQTIQLDNGPLTKATGWVPTRKIIDSIPF